MTTRQFTFLLSAVLAIIFVPYLGLYLDNGKIPPGTFDFPPTNGTDKVPFNWLIASGFILSFLIILLLYLFPSLFGFRKGSFLPLPKIRVSGLPVWFWIGLLSWVSTMVVMATHQPEPKWLINWAIIPFCWGFTLFLDGLVYAINQRKSMISENPTELFAMGIVSISGWLLFEYLNFFIGLNWYYPKAKLVEPNEFILYAVLGSSGFIPMCFEWYQLLRCSKVLNNRFIQGPKFKCPKPILWGIFVLVLVALFATPFYPQKLFYMLWVAPLILLSVVLVLLNKWTPFKSIMTHGDWSALLLFALTFLLQGVMLECWNYISAEHLSSGLGKTYNPAYWIYTIPYVSKWFVFEMPLLGYAGYLFFSIHCWIWWITFVHLMDIKSTFSLGNDFR